MRNKLIQKDTRKKYNTILGSINEELCTSRNKSTGHRGVYRLVNGKYQARINIDGKEVTLINTWSLYEAISVRKNAERKYYHPLVSKAIKNGDFKI